MTTFERIKKISKDKGYSLKQVAIKAGLSENAIYRYNQGVEPKYNTLKVIADALHVSVEELTGDSKIKSSSTDDNGDIDLEKEIAKGRTVRWEGREIPPEEWEMFRRIMEGGK
ncbi:MULTISPECIES: helix-turn-helix domain-containing protein [Companilactobacillus]|uniref:HTH cro/C1-type domain-containing protein n=1 Tax=Companilactobacillus nantensis DSM 16982 TaxID=1423774 RepID=A0A0R1WI89_9LACO|nr:helix-turn-helix transcriptional regulator [Companilactobacillus nantensis]KRM17457.1 hypothetical protein FD31_GL002647 [Companilactobacillus nantensis DSM 16982]GEO64428.1 hypothetical protein LNA01_16110 [Companilactobacillus nantensis]